MVGACVLVLVQFQSPPWCTLLLINVGQHTSAISSNSTEKNLDVAIFFLQLSETACSCCHEDTDSVREARLLRLRSKYLEPDSSSHQEPPLCSGFSQSSKDLSVFGNHLYAVMHYRSHCCMGTATFMMMIIIVISFVARVWFVVDLIDWLIDYLFAQTCYKTA